MMKKSKLIFTCIVLASIFLISSVSAEPKNAVSAKKIVKNWLKNSQNPLGEDLKRKIDKIQTVTDANGTSIFHVAEFENGGYVIVSPDDEIEPIIAFSGSGSFDYSNENPLYSVLANDMSKRIKAIKLAKKQNSGTSNSKSKDKWLTFEAEGELDSVTVSGLSVVSDLRAAPIIQSTWGQEDVGGSYCYNYYTPSHYPCGCTATATSQLMRYHEFGSGGYNWSNMPLNPDGSMTLSQRQEIGWFVYDVAQAIGTTYGATGSSASLWDADTELVSTFGYSNSIRGSISSVNSDFVEMVNTNLDAQLPVLLGLEGSSGGHAVVCDGYGYSSSTLYHHLNMGWDGNEDAWYALPIVDSSYYYNNINTCVYNIFTTGTGEIISGRVLDMAGNPIENATVTATSGGSYQSITNSNGIYAIVVPSNATYTVQASKSPYLFSNRNASVGNSTDGRSYSGNVSQINFTSQNLTPPEAIDDTLEALSGNWLSINLVAYDEGYPNPLTYKIISLPEHGQLQEQGVGVIDYVPYTLSGNAVSYQSCAYFVGVDQFEFIANDGGTSPSGGDSNIGTITLDVNNIITTTLDYDHDPANFYVSKFPFYSSAYDARSQYIYLQSEIGDEQLITHLSLRLYDSPSTTYNNWTIRLKHVDFDSYSNPSSQFQTTGFTTVYQADETLTGTDWITFELDTPFLYNGVENLLVDMSFNNLVTSSDTRCYSANITNRTLGIVSTTGNHGDPLNWSLWTTGFAYTSTLPYLRVVSQVYAPNSLSADIWVDCSVNLGDLSYLGMNWLTNDSKADIAPAPNGDGMVDLLDYATLAEHWLEQY